MDILVKTRNWIAQMQLLLAALLGIVFMIGAAVFGYRENWTGAATSAAIGLVLVLLSHFDKLESIKGFGIEGKLRTLDDKIVQADRGMEALRSLAKLSGTMLLKLAATTGRWDSALGIKELHGQAMTVRNLLRQLNVDEDVVRSVLLPYVDISTVIMARELLKPLREKLMEMGRALDKEIQGLPIYESNQEQRTTIVARRNKIIGHANAMIRSLPDVPYQFRGQKVIELIVQAPELPPEEVQLQLAAAKQAVSEIEYLAEHFDFRNTELAYSIVETP